MPVTITYPVANENDLCASDFKPKGNIDEAGTLTAELNGGYSASATQVTVDSGQWTAQFAAFAVPPSPCTLTVYLNDVAVAQVSGLQFQNC